MLGEYLDRDRAVQPRVARAINLPHPAGADRRDDLVGTEHSGCIRIQIDSPRDFGLAASLAETVERASRPDIEPARSDGRSGETLVVEGVDGQQLEVPVGPEYRDVAALTGEVELAIGDNRRGEVVVEGSMEPSATDDVAGPRVERG